MYEFDNGGRGEIREACITELFNEGDATATVLHQLVFLSYAMFLFGIIGVEIFA